MKRFVAFSLIFLLFLMLPSCAITNIMSNSKNILTGRPKIKEEINIEDMSKEPPTFNRTEDSSQSYKDTMTESDFLYTVKRSYTADNLNKTPFKLEDFPQTDAINRVILEDGSLISSEYEFLIIELDCKKTADSGKSKSIFGTDNTHILNTFNIFADFSGNYITMTSEFAFKLNETDTVKRLDNQKHYYYFVLPTDETANMQLCYIIYKNMKNDSNLYIELGLDVEIIGDDVHSELVAIPINLEGDV